MEIIQICPVCGAPGIGVKDLTVRYNLKNSKWILPDKRVKWSICPNPSCNCSYFNKYRKYSESDLINPLFFKDRGDNVPICYCSDLTRGEIKDAVKNDCKTIKDVQKYTKKDITGLCETRNPLGKCCKNAFLKTISNG